MTDRESPSFPVLILTFLGALICILGLFAAGDLIVVAVGLGAIFAAGVLDVSGRFVRRAERPNEQPHGSTQPMD